MKYRIVSPRGHVTDEGHLRSYFISNWRKEFYKYKAEARIYYMGDTPGKDSLTCIKVKKRMERQGKYRPDTHEVLYMRDPSGDPVASGTWYPESVCVMGHIIDAVTWWNSNDRFTGQRSATVLKFMEDADNYELEPSGPNSARGAKIKDHYRHPTG